ncbi:MAG: glycine cleavage system protein GcvH [Rhizobiales bacterium]|nr:glycine cleavage system protein GcvH [Hyphomicrobiales bacterium]
MNTKRFTEDHEWISVNDGIGTIGITDYAQEHLGDIVFVQLPEVGKSLKKRSAAAVVESVKAASDVYAPVSGEVVEVNTGLEESPEIVNEEAMGKGWFFKIKLSQKEELDGLMTEEDYKSFVAKSA